MTAETGGTGMSAWLSLADAVGHSAYGRTGEVALRHHHAALYNQAIAEQTMNTLTPSWSIPASCATSVQWLEERLLRAGLRALRTFDLHDARLASMDCTCPRHGMIECDCQMVVVLVYSETQPPVALMVHGNDGQSWISVVDRPDQRADRGTILAIQGLLDAEVASDP
jgi:hypothetical protein